MKTEIIPQSSQVAKPELHLETTRVNFKNILLATDFSKSSQAALQHAISVAKQFCSNLFVLHAVPPAIYSGEIGVVDPSFFESSSSYAKLQMEKLPKEPGLRWVQHKEIVSYDPVLPSIEDAVTKYNIDLIVMGTHGSSGVAKIVMGSVAEAVLRTSRCPVMVVGPRSRLDNMKYGSILLATDLRPGSLRPAQYAVAIAEEMDAKITLLYVAEQMRELAGHERLENEIMEKLEQLLPADADLWCRPKLCVDFGVASGQILEAARVEGADLIVVGVREAALAHHAPWATVSKVIRGATCPVLAVRAHVE